MGLTLARLELKASVIGHGQELGFCLGLWLSIDGQQGRRSLWDRETCPPIFTRGDVHGNVPQYFRSDVV